jgi:hypothetical protein
MPIRNGEVLTFGLGREFRQRPERHLGQPIQAEAIPLAPFLALIRDLRACYSARRRGSDYRAQRQCNPSELHAIRGRSPLHERIFEAVEGRLRRSPE